MQLCYFSGMATHTLKVFQLEDISPRCLSACVLSCYVAGGTTLVLYTLTQPYIWLVTQYDTAQMLGWTKQQGLYPGPQTVYSNGTENPLVRISMTEANLHEQDFQVSFKERDKALVPSMKCRTKSVHILVQKMQLGSPLSSLPLSYIYCCRNTLCYWSFPLLWSQLVRQSYKNGEVHLLIRGLCWDLAESISTSFNNLCFW